MLHSWWAARPAIIDYDRSAHGDFFKKPTMFFFFCFAPTFAMNCKMYQKERMRVTDVRAKNGKTSKVNKSLISQTYADYFVDTFIFGTK